MVLKNSESELSYILAKLFNICLREFRFRNYWKVSLVVLLVKNVRERSTPENYCPICLLFMVNKVCDKPVNNRIVDHLEKCNFFFVSSMVLGLLD